MLVKESVNLILNILVFARIGGLLKAFGNVIHAEPHLTQRESLVTAVIIDLECYHEKQTIEKQYWLHKE